VFFLLLGFTPLILHSMGEDDLVIAGFNFLQYREIKGEMVGPFGIGAAMLSLFIPLGLGLSIGLYYHAHSQNLMKIREESKRLEQEFASALFQLGNRIGDGLPAEIAFSKVADTMEGTPSGDFFMIVSTNIRKLGMNVARAIFDPKIGALMSYPSNMIESSMKVLIESVRKGPMICAAALMNISQYIKEMHRVDERLKDLMADVISSMKSQISFLTPVIAGIVIGITSMISNIMMKLVEDTRKLSAESGDAAANVGALPNILGEGGIPTYFFQMMVGVYVVQIAYILTGLANGIENGEDKLNERYLLGTNVPRSTILYVVIAGVIILSFNYIASQIVVMSRG
jgi:hypothetical protein